MTHRGFKTYFKQQGLCCEVLAIANASQCLNHNPSMILTTQEVQNLIHNAGCEDGGGKNLNHIENGLFLQKKYGVYNLDWIKENLPAVIVINTYNNDGLHACTIVDVDLKKREVTVVNYGSKHKVVDTISWDEIIDNIPSPDARRCVSYSFRKRGYVNLIVAYSPSRCIGKDNKMPWHIPQDLNGFKNITMNNVCIMGRNTFNSIVDAIGKPLPSRENIVITSNPNNLEWRDLQLNGLDDDMFDDLLGLEEPPRKPVVASSIENALAVARKMWPTKEVFVIGGTKIYTEFLKRDLVDNILASEIFHDYQGDAHFPSINDKKWNRTPIRRFDEYEFVTYERDRSNM